MGRIGKFLIFRRAEKALACGSFARAAELFRAAWDDRAHPALSMKKAVAEWETGLRREGLAQARAAAAALAPEHPARLFLALLLAEEGKRGEAAAIVGEVRGADPANPFARGIEALLSIRGGDPGKVSEILKEGVFGSPLFRAHLLCAVEEHLRSNMKKEDWKEAYLETVL